MHLEPDLTGSVEISSSSRCLGHVDVDHTLMVETVRDVGTEANGLAGRDRESLSGRLELGVVASHIWAGDIFDLRT